MYFSFKARFTYLNVCTFSRMAIKSFYMIIESKTVFNKNHNMNQYSNRKNKKMRIIFKRMIPRNDASTSISKVTLLYQSIQPFERKFRIYYESSTT